RVGKWASYARFDVCPLLPRAVARAQRSVDVLHLHVPNPTMLLALAAAGVRRPLVVADHSDVGKQKAPSLALRPFEHLVFRRTAALLATSPPYAAGSAVLRRHADRVRVLPFGIDLRPYREPSPRALAFAERLKAEYGGPLWLAVGRLVYYKGL